MSGWSLLAVSALLLATCNRAPGRAKVAPGAIGAAAVRSIESGAPQGTGVTSQTSSALDASAASAPSPPASSVTTAAIANSRLSAPQAPSIQFHDEESTATEFQLEEAGFPAISADGKVIALAFHELADAGPPALELTVQLRSVQSGKVVYETAFREPYQGELDNVYLDALRRRVRRWLSATQRKLTQVKLVTMSPIVHDEAAVCSDNPKPIRIPTASLEVHFDASRLIVRADNARVLFNHEYPEWTTAYESQGQRCVFKPYVTQVSFDAQHQLLVVGARHCSPGDMCTKRVIPKFAVIELTRDRAAP